MTEPTGGPNVDPSRGGNPLEGFQWNLPEPEAPYQPVVTPSGKPDTARFDPISAEPGGTGDGPPATPPAPPRKPWWKRPLPWALIGVAVVLAGAGVAIAVSLANRETAPTPAASTVTLAQPAPTIAPSPLPAGATAFLRAQPTKVLSYALVSAVRDTKATSGAIESWRLGYSDGSSAAPISVYAEQYPDASSAKSAVGFYLKPAVVASATPAPTAPAAAPSATAGASASASTAPTVAPEYGPVAVGGKEVGRYYRVQNKDKTETVVWFNGTAFFVAKGPAGVMKDFFLVYPL